MIPFVPEIRMNLEMLQLALAIFKKRNLISKLIEDITSTDDEVETNQAWARIFSVSKEICNIELCGETIAEHKNLVKMTAPTILRARKNRFKMLRPHCLSFLGEVGWKRGWRTSNAWPR